MEQVTDNRSLALRVKAMIGHRNWRFLVTPVKAVLNVMPSSLLYRVGLKLRRNTYPYRLIEDGDTVVQVGAPSDLLKAGRSRSIYFSMLVGTKGRAIIFEPEPTSVIRLNAFLEKMKLKDRVTVVPKGCWHEETDLVFFSNPNHPASNLVGDTAKYDEEELRARGYEKIVVPVTTLDKTLAELGADTPKLISVTTNGSEEQIIAGAAETIAKPHVHIALAETGPNMETLLEKTGFYLTAKDDRGFTYSRSKPT